MTVQQDILLANVGTYVELYVLDLTPRGGPVLRFTPHTVAGGANVSFGGQVYQPLPVRGEGWETSIDGAPPRPTLVISNVTRFIQPFLIQYGDCVGARLTRTVTLADYLDSGPTPDGSQVIFTNAYLVEQKKSQNKREVIFTLSTLIDNPMRTIPAWKVLRTEFPGAGLFRRR